MNQNHTAGFTALHSETRDHARESHQGGTRIQGGVKARRIMQDLMIAGQKEGKEKRWLIQDAANLTLTSLPKRGRGALNSLALHP